MINEHDKLHRVELGDYYMFEFEQVLHVSKDDLNNLLLMDTALDCFQYMLKKLKDVKRVEDKVDIIPFDKNVIPDRVAINHTQLRSNSPFNFAPIKYLSSNGIQYELTKNSNTKPDKKSINEILKTLKDNKCEILKFDESNYIVEKNGNMILYNLQHIKRNGDIKKCKARSLLKSLLK
jgi:hypothetical protein